MFILKESVAFSSPSSAASVLAGININGQIYWKDNRGRMFRELHPTDRRKKMIKLTLEGKRVCQEILDMIAQAELEALSELGEDEQRLLFKLTTRFCKGLVSKLTAAATREGEELSMQ